MLCKTIRLLNFFDGPGHRIMVRVLLWSLVVPGATVPAAWAERDVTGARAEDRAVFWEIRRDGEPAGYLLGTVHSEDPRVLDFTEDFLARLRENELFAMEMVPDLPTLARLTDYMRYGAGESLEAVAGSQRYAALVAALAGYQVPEEFISRMKPWAAMMTLSTPPPKTGFFMDLSLSLRASGNGLRVAGLETLEQQLAFLEEMPLAMQLTLLDQAIAEAHRVQQSHDLMVNAYLQNDLAVLLELSDEQLLQVGKEARDYFIESGIRARNLRMAESLLSHLEQGRVFAAVGALHLPGETGLLELIRRKGYELAPLPMPFPDMAGVRSQ